MLCEDTKIVQVISVATKNSIVNVAIVDGQFTCGCLPSNQDQLQCLLHSPSQDGNVRLTHL